MFSIFKIILVLIPLQLQIDACGKYGNTRCDNLCGPHTCNKNDAYQQFCWNICGPGIQNSRVGRKLKSSKPVCTPPKKAVRRYDGTYRCQKKSSPRGRSGFQKPENSDRAFGRLLPPVCPPPLVAVPRSDGTYYCHGNARLGGRSDKPSCAPPEMAIRDRCDGPFYCSIKPREALPEKPQCGGRATSDQYPDGTWSPCMQCIIG